MVPFIKNSTMGKVTIIRLEIAWSWKLEWGSTKKEPKSILVGDKNILNFSYGGDYTIV